MGNCKKFKDVAFGAIVTLKNHRTGGGYLHSHWHLYPENVGAKQQQASNILHWNSISCTVLNLTMNVTILYSIIVYFK